MDLGALAFAGYAATQLAAVIAVRSCLNDPSGRPFSESANTACRKKKIASPLLPAEKRKTPSRGETRPCRPAV